MPARHTAPREHPTLQTVVQTLHLIRTPLTVNYASLWQCGTGGRVMGDVLLLIGSFSLPLARQQAHSDVP